jgi:hypothetical protein
MKRIEENKVRKTRGEIIKRNHQGKSKNIEVKVEKEGEINKDQGHQKGGIEIGGRDLVANLKGRGHVGEAIQEDLKGERTAQDRRVPVKIELKDVIKVKVEINLGTEVGANVDQGEINSEVSVSI